jgi:oligoendopeptidase F
MIKNEMVWDLAQLVENTDPASIREKLESMVDGSMKFRDKYRGRIGDLDGRGLLELLETKDALTLKFEGETLYCRLSHASNTTDGIAKQLYDASRTALMKTRQSLTFVDIEVGKLLADNPSLIEDPSLVEYEHYLERILRRVPHLLSETEERLIITKDKNGINAWEMLWRNWLSTATFDVEINGEIKTLPFNQRFAISQSPDRDLRRRANKAICEVVKKDRIIPTSALRAICTDHLQTCELRGYPHPIDASYTLNDVDKETIDGLMRTVENNVGLYRRYLALKARLMGLERLTGYDLRAPLPHIPDKQYTWRETRELVMGAYTDFDEEVGGWVDEMYERRHIDGEVREGKMGGAFCAKWMSGKSAYVLQNFSGILGKVFTQAHELGHAVHAYLGSRVQKPSNFEIGDCIAECGSVFGELLLTERLLSQAETQEERQVVLVKVLDGFVGAVFRISVRFFFEKSVYDAIEDGEFLSSDTVSELYSVARNIIYGKSVDWPDATELEWATSIHYYYRRFLSYPYTFAQLFVFALYKLYKEQGREFVPKIKSLLAAGSSKSPTELAAELGFNIGEENFWMKGIKQAEEFIEMLEAIL